MGKILAEQQRSIAEQQRNMQNMKMLVAAVQRQVEGGEGGNTLPPNFHIPSHVRNGIDD
jgi:hypothetical protein